MRRILVVEDNPDLADLVTLNLRDEGYAVESIGDGSLALAKLQAEPYDLVILDLMLPGMDGLMLCKQLRNRPDYLPILMLTAKSTELDRVLEASAAKDIAAETPLSADHVASPNG